MHKAKLVFYVDYELQKGADSAKTTKGKWTGYDEHKQTQELLSLLDNYNIKSTFSVLGYTAEKGNLPYHAPKQIKEISKQGHEIASHTYNHEHIPDLSLDELRKTLSKSKKILEKVSGQKVISFVPPHNMPADFHGISLSLKPNLNIRPSKITVNELCRVLDELGYKTYRNNYWTPFKDKIFRRYNSYDVQTVNNINLFNINCDGGFTNHAEQVVRHAVKNKKTAVVFGHPCLLNIPGPENIKYLEKFLKFVNVLKKKNKIEIKTPREFV